VLSAHTLGGAGTVCEREPLGGSVRGNDDIASASLVYPHLRIDQVDRNITGQDGGAATIDRPHAGRGANRLVAPT